MVKVNAAFADSDVEADSLSALAPFQLIGSMILPFVWLFRRRSPLGAGLALGGGLSNLWERVRYGRVYDYVRFPKLPRLWRYVWNLADFAIVLGGTLLALLDRKK